MLQTNILSLLSKLEGNYKILKYEKKNLIKLKDYTYKTYFLAIILIELEFSSVLMLILINGQRYNFFSYDQLHAINGWHYIFWFCTFLHIILSMENQNSRTQKREKKKPSSAERTAFHLWAVNPTPFLPPTLSIRPAPTSNFDIKTLHIKQNTKIKRKMNYENRNTVITI